MKSNILKIQAIKFKMTMPSATKEIDYWQNHNKVIDVDQSSKLKRLQKFSVRDLQKTHSYPGPHSCYLRIVERVEEQGIRTWY